MKKRRMSFDLDVTTAAAIQTLIERGFEPSEIILMQPETLELVTVAIHDQHTEEEPEVTTEPFSSRLAGDIKCANPRNPEYCETIMRQLEEFMIEHDLDKIDIGWSRSGMLKATHSNNDVL